MLRRIAIAVVVILTWSTLALSDRGTVLVFSFENQSGDRNLDWIGEGIASLVVERLHSEPELYVFQREERLAVFERAGVPETAAVSRATAMKLGWDCGADRIVVGHFTSDAGDFSASARIVDLVSSHSSEEIKVSGKLDDLIPLTSALSWQILKMIAPATRVPESGDTAGQPVPRSAFEDFVRGILATDFDRRSQYLEDAIRLHPQYPEALFDLGRLKHLEGDFSGSNERLNKVPSSSPDYATAQFFIGLNDYYLGNYAQAVKVYSALPPSYDVLVNLAAAQAETGETAAAAATWKRAAERDPFGVEAPFNLGYSSFSRGDMEGAIRNLEQTLRLEGRDAEAMFLLARAYERVGRAGESQKMLAQAIRISPRIERWQSQPLPKVDRLRPEPNPAALRDSDPRYLWSAERLARKARGQDLAAWVEFVQNEVDSQSYGEAMREIRELTSVFPNAADAYILTGEIHEQQKEYEQAIADYGQAINLHPSVEAYVLLAKTYRAQKRISQAMAAVQQALKLDPRNVAALALKAELEKQPLKRTR